MEELVKVRKLNESFLKVDCSPSVSYELNDFFSYEVNGARFMPAVKSGRWDGKIRLFGLMSREMYTGLYLYLHQFCKERGYEIEKIESEYGLPLDVHPIDIVQIEKYAEHLNLHHDGEAIKLRDHQLQGIYYSIRHRGKLLLSPTGSGKSLIIYVIIRYLKSWFESQNINKSQLIVVPRTGLVEQLYSDFEDYSSANKWPVKDLVSKVYSGLPKNPSTPIVITTWQSIYKLPESYFQNYGTVIGDEAHTWKAKCLTMLMSKCTEAPFRIGLTGTLDGIEINKLVLEGLFGSIHRVASTRELIDNGTLSELKIKAIVLKYSDAERHKVIKDKDYQSEIEFLISHPKRNKFIRNLALAQKSNTLVLFNRVGKHGQILYEMIKEKASDGRKVYFIHGGVAPVDRENIRKIVQKENDAIILASYGTFQLGVNIPNLHSIIFGSPSKSKIRNLQSIGRGLRTSDDKEFCTLFDIADDLQWKSKTNHTLNHLLERIDIYNSENFDYNIIEVTL